MISFFHNRAHIGILNICSLSKLGYNFIKGQIVKEMIGNNGYVFFVFFAFFLLFWGRHSKGYTSEISIINFQVSTES